MDEYPEHKKLRAVSDQTQAAGSFLEWLTSERGIELVDKDGAPVWTPLHQLLAEWKDIDTAVIEQEKQHMLETLRSKA